MSLTSYQTTQTMNTVVDADNKDDTNVITVPILMYHSLLNDKKLQGDYVISPALFKNDIRALKKLGYTIIGAQDLIDYSNGKLSLPQKCAMLTFDDGYYNNYIYAYQIAKEENIKFILSPVVSDTEKSNSEKCLSPSYSNCNWSQLREMANSGYVEIFSHSYNMHKTTHRKGTKILPGESTSQYHELLTDDLGRAQQLFKKELGFEPIGFTYPFGLICDESKQIVKEMGFKISLTCEERPNFITPSKPDGLLNMGRYLRNNKETSEKFLKRVLPN